MTEPRLKVVLCWHMHQPDYRDPLTGRAQAPWTYLHAIKDYTDMAAHLEAQPAARAVVNFSAILLDQLAAYAGDLKQMCDGTGPGQDPLLAALHGSELPHRPKDCLALIRACLQANRTRVIEHFPRYRVLADLGERVLEQPQLLAYLSDAFLADLLVWYHLAWLGETVRRRDTCAQELIARGRDFSLADRQALTALIAREISGLIPRYRELSASGQVELSVTPYSHPILPLLLDFHAAREAWPDCPLPAGPQFPGGEERARWQLAEARRRFVHHFGHEPQGCWPAEGGVSEPLLGLIDDAGFRWAASGQGVLRQSLGLESPGSAELHRAYRVKDEGPVCFFRDDELSDAIGFVYKDWHGDDAVANLVSRLEHIAAGAGGDCIVPIILDGENAWEHYPDNGYHFLGALYASLGEHPRLQLTTFAEALSNGGCAPARLDRLVAGSWVYGSFSTWIGEVDKNRAWELLVAAKQAYDRVRPGLGEERARQAERQLALCECSDWFWWLGEAHRDDIVSRFESLFRTQLTALYRTLELEPPEPLSRPFAKGLAQGSADTMLRAER